MCKELRLGNNGRVILDGLFEIQFISRTQRKRVKTALFLYDLELYLGREIRPSICSGGFADFSSYIPKYAKQDGCSSEALLAVENFNDSIRRLRQGHDGTKEMLVSPDFLAGLPLILKIVPKCLYMCFLPHVATLESWNYSALPRYKRE